MACPLLCRASIIQHTSSIITCCLHVLMRHPCIVIMLKQCMLEARNLRILYGGYSKYCIDSDTPCSNSQNDFRSFRCVIWLLTQWFKPLSFFTFISLRRGKVWYISDLTCRSYWAHGPITWWCACERWFGCCVTAGRCVLQLAGAMLEEHVTCMDEIFMQIRARIIDSDTQRWA